VTSPMPLILAATDTTVTFLVETPEQANTLITTPAIRLTSFLRTYLPGMVATQGAQEVSVPLA